MKKYRLKKWYPSLHKDWVVGDIVIPWEKQKNYYHVPNKSTTIYKEEVENNPDFWELIEQNLLEEYLDVNTSDIDKRIGSIAIEALENIANPLNYLLEEAKKERRSLDAYIAGKLMENPYFYADIAEKALRLIKQTKAMQEELILKERSKE